MNRVVRSAAVLAVIAWGGYGVRACAYGSMALNGKSITDGTNISIDNNTLKLAADTDTTFHASAIAVHGKDATIELASTTAGTDRDQKSAKPVTLTLDGPATFGPQSILNVKGPGNYLLALASLSAAQGGCQVNPQGASVSIDKLSGGDMTLGGSSNHNSVNIFDGRFLQFYGTGTWTITGDNSSRKWSGDLGSGTLVVAKGASIPSLTIGKGTLALMDGASTGTIRATGGGTIDLTHGPIGNATVKGQFCVYSSNSINFKFKLDAHGCSHVMLAGGVDPSNDIRDFVTFDISGDALTPGTYTLVTGVKGGNTLLENHFGFEFKGDPANHANIVRTKTYEVGGKKYDITICTADEVNDTQKVTMTVKAD